MAIGTAHESLPKRLRIDDWQIQPRDGVIRRGKDLVSLRPKSMDVLVYLVLQAPEVVSKDELIERCWAPAIVSGNSVEGVINDLRKALGDDTRHPTYIKTVFKRGYRVIASVRGVEVAIAIARALAAELTSDEHERIDQKATASLAAYRLVQRTREQPEGLTCGISEENRLAISMLEQTVRSTLATPTHVPG